MEILFIAVCIGLLLFVVLKKKQVKYVSEPFKEEWKKFLEKKVEFYRELYETEKAQFEQRIQLFLSEVKIIGVNTEINKQDKLLVAASAVIPVFSFPNWRYRGLREVLLYPGMFNERYEIGKPDCRISGMVGTGVMEGKMILSTPALHHGFGNDDDKKNVGVHEFVHLVDKADGNIDGIPQVLIDNAYALPWLDLIKQKMEDIHSNDSDINPYGGVDKSEFFPVAAEYFFERPKLLKQKHPELYKQLNSIFSTDLANTYKGNDSKATPGRNDKCVCGSGKKYKRCCGLK
jgi:Mlc titration factor MtfA (ptsG expression regulator)